MLDESVACLRESIVADPDLLDAGIIFGTGFAPFRGGPMYYIQQQGIDKSRQQLEELKEKYGETFDCDDGWATM